MPRATTETRGAVRRVRWRQGVLGACLVLGLLFWARLIVVTDMPRTAIADPESTPTIDESSDKDDARGVDADRVRETNDQASADRVRETSDQASADRVRETSD